MKTLTSLMLIELAKTDRAMSWAVKHNRKDIYDQIFNIRQDIMFDWIYRPTLSMKDYLKLKIY